VLKIVNRLCCLLCLWSVIVLAACGKQQSNSDSTESGFTTSVHAAGSFDEMSVDGLEAYLSSEKEQELYGMVEELLSIGMTEEMEYSGEAFEDQEEEDEYSNFAIANVDNYVNVRSGPNTDSEIVGRMYDGAVAQIQEEIECEDGIWLNVISGSLSGYIKAEYFIYGQNAVEVIDNYIDRYATVLADRLNIRENPDIESKRIGYANTNEKLKLVDDQTDGEWIHVCYGEDKSGYVSAEYVSVAEEFIYAKTMEEIRAKEAEEKELKAREKQKESETPENVTIVQSETATQTSSSFTASGNLRSDIVSFALQYVGHPYVHGGNSLENGTDCSGFTSLVMAQFGVGLSRTPGGQLSVNGRSIGLDEIQPGDIVCYGKSKCTHVAIYIGNGQIVHAANPRKGIVTQNVGYDNILGVKNVLD